MVSLPGNISSQLLLGTERPPTYVLAESSQRASMGLSPLSLWALGHQIFFFLGVDLILSLSCSIGMYLEGS